jgi:hypothetical protein
MSSLSNAVLDIQNAMIAAPCIDDFTVTHVESDEDRPERVRISYTLANGFDAITDSEALFAHIESIHGLVVVYTKWASDGFYIVYEAAE